MNASLYSIIGGDGVEYGPVSEVEIRLWIDQGRANSETSIQLEGTDSWITLADLPEFSASLASQAELSVARQPAPPLDSPAALEHFILKAASLDIGLCFDRSISLLKKHPFQVIAGPALIFFVSLGLEFVPVIGPLLSLTFGVTLWAGLDWFFLKLVRGQPFVLLDCFAGFQRPLLQLTLAGIVSSVLVIAGFFLCIIPGLYLMIAWLSFGPLLVMDKRLDFWSSFELSRRVVTAHLWTFIALFLASFAILIGGILVMGLGFFIALPIVTGAVVYAYEDIFS